jgi:undecaprenyl-diphosphatase
MKHALIASAIAALCVAAAHAQTTQPATMPVVYGVDKPVPPPPGSRITLRQAVILGVVEGVTEYLPVSSTGHLILAGHWMGLTHQIDEPAWLGRRLEKTPAIDAFDVVIQLGAILAVLGLYRKRVALMIAGLRGKSEQGFHLLTLLIIAFAPAALAGYFLHRPIETHLFAPEPVAVALAAGGLAMIIVDRMTRARKRPVIDDVCSITYWQAFIIGLAQCLSMWPGTSRSMITIIAALLLGVSMLAAAEFSFLLALPTLGAATIYSGFKARDALLASAGWDGLIVGVLVSAVTAALAVKLLVAWLTRHGLAPFGVYRLLLAAGLLWYFLHGS